MLERTIENRLISEVRKAGGICPKFTSPGTAGMPDRLIILPGGHIGFVELKAPGQRPRRIQEVRHEQLRKLDAPVHVLDSPDIKDIDRILNAIRSA